MLFFGIKEVAAHPHNKQRREGSCTMSCLLPHALLQLTTLFVFFNGLCKVGSDLNLRERTSQELGRALHHMVCTTWASGRGCLETQLQLATMLKSAE